VKGGGGGGGVGNFFKNKMFKKFFFQFFKKFASLTVKLLQCLENIIGFPVLVIWLFLQFIIKEIIEVRVVTNMLCLLHLQLPGRVGFGERMVYGSCRDVQLLKRVILHWRFTKDEVL
jgi:hypothetical protein